MGEREVRVATVDVDVLRGLLEQAKERPWLRGEAQDGEVFADGSGYAGDYYETTEIIEVAGDVTVHVAETARADQAALIVAAVNALPSLLDELVALRGYGEKVRKLLNSLRDDIDPRVDIEDGPNGEPRANFAMRVQQEIDAILAIRVPA